MKIATLVFCLLFTLLQLTAQEPEAVPAPKEIPAPREDLKPVPLPDLSSAEEVVGNQITRFQRSLQTMISAGVADLELSNAYGLLAMVYHAYGIRVSAVPAYQNARVLAPDEFKWPYLVSLLLKERGDSEYAIEALEKAGEIQPRYTAVWAHLGDLHSQFNRYEIAEANYRKALELNPESAHAYHGLGQLAIYQKKYKEAIPFLKKAAELAPAANRIHYGLARAYRAIGDMETAKIHIAQTGKVGITEHDPLSQSLQRHLRGERVFMARGKTAFNAKRYEEAAEAFTKAVASKPDSIRARVNLATSLVYLGRYDEAVNEFRRVLEEQPGNPTALYNLAAIYESANRLSDAEQLFRQFLSDNPNDNVARMRLAHTLVKQGGLEEAGKLYQQVTAMQPLDLDGYLNYAIVLRESGDWDKALAVLREGLERMPDQGLIAHELARSLTTVPHEEHRNGARALELAQVVVNASPTVEHIQTLALAFAETGACDQAVEWQTKAYQAARDAGQEELAEKLFNNLQHYRTSRPCRAPVLQTEN